jgi:hypothetical protein
VDDAIGTPLLDGADVFARLEAVERRLAGHAALPTPDGLTEPDPDTPEERWEAGHVWAHIAEFVPYWLGEIRAVIGGFDGNAVPFGRIKTDPGRIAAIEVGHNEPVGSQMARTSEAVAEVRRFLNGLTPAEWNAVGRHPTRGEMDVEAMVERFIVAHLEEHAEQLDRLA